MANKVLRIVINIIRFFVMRKLSYMYNQSLWLSPVRLLGMYLKDMQNVLPWLFTTSIEILF